MTLTFLTTLNIKLKNISCVESCGGPNTFVCQELHPVTATLPLHKVHLFTLAALRKKFVMQAARDLITNLLIIRSPDYNHL